METGFGMVTAWRKKETQSEVIMMTRTMLKCVER